MTENGEGNFSALADDGSRADRKRNPHSSGNRDKFKSDRAEGVTNRPTTNQFFAADGRTTATWDVAGGNGTDNVLRKTGKPAKDGTSKRSSAQPTGHGTVMNHNRDVVLTDNVEEKERRMVADAPKAPANYQLDDVFDVAYREMQYNNTYGGAVAKPAVTAPPPKEQEDEFDF